MAMESELQQVMDNFKALSEADRAAFLHVMEALANAPESADSLDVMLAAARETGNANAIDAAERQFAKRN